MDQAQKVTKKQIIEALLKEGKKAKEIQAITGFSLGYIGNIKEDMDNPGILDKRRKKWLFNHDAGSVLKYKKTYKKNNKEKWAKSQKRNRIRHAIATRPYATNHRQQWTNKDIDYLEQYGQLKTARELALDLGRTYNAVISVARVYEIDLRGNKTKTHSSRVPSQPPQSTPNLSPVLTA